MISVEPPVQCHYEEIADLRKMFELAVDGLHRVQALDTTSNLDIPGDLQEGPAAMEARQTLEYIFSGKWKLEK